MVQLFILIIAGLINILLGLFVLLNNKKSVTNKMFCSLTFVFALWSIVTFISIHPVILDQLTWVRLVLFTAALLNLFVYLTFAVFPALNFNGRSRFRVFAILYTVLVMALTLSPLVFKGLKQNANGSHSPVPAPGIALFMLQTILLLGGGTLLLVRKFIRASGLQRQQFKNILIGLIISWSLIVTTNFILVLLFNVTALVALGPAFTVIFSGTVAYTIIRNRLFDIKAAVGRSVAYILSIGLLVFGYAALSSLIVNTTFSDFSNGSIQLVFNTVIFMIAVLVYPSIKNFFDKITKRLFYRDSYDIKDVLDKLGNSIVTEIDLHKILFGTRQVLSDSLKSSFVEFILFKENIPYLEAGTHKTLQTDIDKLMEHIKDQHKEVIITDDLGQQNIFRQWLADNEVGLSLRLKTQHQVVGYILFGDKKSGDIYNNEDERLLTIVADELAIAIQNALRFEEIEQFNVTLQQKVDEATRKLRQTNEKLKALDETKDEFISMASHQLRTPLTSVKGYVSMVLEGDAGKISDMQKKLLDQAFLSSQRMVYLIADLLNVSRLRTGKFVIDSKPTQLAEVIESEIAQLTETAKSRGLELTYSKPKDFPMLMLDDTKIRQVIMNFADNAIYYTQSGANRGHIRIALEDKGTSVEFTVADDGIGVPKESQHHLFTKFYRAGNAQHARPDGTGLGLFMAKKVIVAQGGAIIFHSEEGKGSTFGFSFPKAQVKVPDHIKPAAPKKSLAKKA